MKMAPKKVEKPSLPLGMTEGTESRLKKLAYLLDQKTQEERELIEKN